MIALDKISVDFGSTRLFNDISFIINKKDKIGLVGKNGAGKSPIFKLIIIEFIRQTITPNNKLTDENFLKLPDTTSLRYIFVERLINLNIREYQKSIRSYLVDSHYQYLDLNFPDFEMIILKDECEMSYKKYFIDKCSKNYKDNIESLFKAQEYK
jgi:ABC-type oligopeptide transport system ATPase subunit